MAGFYDIEAEDVMCDVHKMDEYKGKVVLVVNTATQCGFTPQYDDLQNIYEKYQQEGLEILDFPCNQFGNQAPESNEDIVSFCDAKFGITFKHYAKIDVNGENEHQLYTFLKAKKRIVRRYKPYLDKIDLTYTQYITMMVLWEDKQINVKELGERLYLDSGTLTPVLKRLEQKKLITRQRDIKDERSLIVTLTDEGRQLREKAVEVPYKMEDCVALDEKDAKDLYRILHKMLNAF